MDPKSQRRWRLASQVLIGLAGVAGILVAADQIPQIIKQWSGLAVALLGFAARWCEQQLPAARGPAAAPGTSSPPPAPPAATTVLLLGLLVLSAGACSSPYATAKRSTWTLMRATQTAGHGLAGLARDADAVCSQKHPSGSEAYKACTAPWLKRLDMWTDYIRPAGRSAVAGLYGSVRVSEAARKPAPDITAAFKAGGCAVLRGVREWGHLLEDAASGVLKLLAGLNPAACMAAKAARPSAVAVGLTLALEIVAWLRKLLTDPADELFREVDAWLRAPPDDGTDEVAAGIRRNLPQARRHAPRRP